MNKYLTIILVVLGIALIAYNATLLDGNALLKGDSLVAVIGIVAALCALLLIVIYNISKKIQRKVEED